jgi:estrogen-related receptor beta like 1
MDGDEAMDGSQPMADLPTVNAEDVIEKLKLLEYDSKFCAQNGFPPLHKVSLIAPASNPNEHFYIFSCLVSWLFSFLRVNFPKPDQYADDPNATSAGIIDALKRAKLPADFPPTKVRSGHGDAACAVLNNLADAALREIGFTFHCPQYEVFNEEDAIQDAGDDFADISAVPVADVEEEYFTAPKSSAVSVAPPLVATVDPEHWRREVDRIAPLLKVHNDGDNREWRARSESTRDLHAAIGSTLPVTEERLQKMGSNVAKAMEKIKSREHTINSQHEQLVSEYRNLRSSLQDVHRRFTDAKEAETSRVNDMKRITDELDRQASCACPIQQRSVINWASMYFLCNADTCK